jgi:hypothetical protein
MIEPKNVEGSNASAIVAAIGEEMSFAVEIGDENAARAAAPPRITFVYLDEEYVAPAEQPSYGHAFKQADERYTVWIRGRDHAEMQKLREQLLRAIWTLFSDRGAEPVGRAKRVPRQASTNGSAMTLDVVMHVPLIDTLWKTGKTTTTTFNGAVTDPLGNNPENLA